MPWSVYQSHLKIAFRGGKKIGPDLFYEGVVALDIAVVARCRRGTCGAAVVVDLARAGKPVKGCLVLTAYIAA